jgi:hypothetical protein
MRMVGILLKEGLNEKEEGAQKDLGCLCCGPKWRENVERGFG